MKKPILKLSSTVKGIIFSLFLISCGGTESTIEDEENVDISEDTVEELSDDVYVSEEPTYKNLSCFKGSIDNKNDIYLEFRIRYAAGGEKHLEGYYFYTSNNIGFELRGKLDESIFELNRFKDGAIRETFTFEFEYDDDGFAYGTWSKGDESLGFTLTELETNSEFTGSFINGVHTIIEDQTNLNLMMDYDQLKALVYGSAEIMNNGDFEGSFSDSKIYCDGSYDNDVGGHQTYLIYALLIPESSVSNSDIQILQLECQNSWVASESIEYVDDDYESYKVNATIFDINGEVVKKGQQVVFDGDGVAEIYFFNNTVVMTAGSRKEVLYYSQQEGALTEH